MTLTNPAFITAHSRVYSCFSVFRDLRGLEGGVFGPDLSAQFTQCLQMMAHRCHIPIKAYEALHLTP